MVRPTAAERAAPENALGSLPSGVGRLPGGGSPRFVGRWRPTRLCVAGEREEMRGLVPVQTLARLSVLDQIRCG